MAAAAAAPAGRQFTFFQLAQVKDAHDAANGPDIFRSVGEILAITTSSFGVLVTDIHGSIHILNQAFESVQNWQAHLNGRVTHMIERKGILVTLGEEESSRLPVLKIWDLEHRDKKTGDPVLLRSAKVQHGNKPHPVSTIALSSSLSHLAIGLGDGTVLLYRHLDQYLFSGSNALSALPKAKIVHESPTEPVTGLGFREPLLSSSDKAEREHLYLFIVTTNRVLSYLAAGKGSGVPPVVVNEVGCGLGCAAMDHRTREMAIARDEAIYMCKPDGLGACYAIEWPKISITSFRNYLVIVSPPFFPSSASASATVRNYVARAPNPVAATQTDVSKVTIFDLENKFIAYSESTFTEGVRDVICDDEHIYILGNDGKLFRMEEKTTSQKLNILSGKSQYVLALSLARSDGLEDGAIATIHRQYGDYLYLKGDYDGAIQQFVNTLGHLQPSYVIRKPPDDGFWASFQFLDAQRIHNLATYLQELHARGLANSDHTTLLLNTYTKLRDVPRLDSFIKAESVRFRGSDSAKGKHSKDELPFDLETAIRVCRQAGYFEHAVYLAKKYERHEDYLRIQIEDAGNIKDALTYLRELGLDAAAANLVKYGRVMLSKLPQETTQLLVEVCSGTSPDLTSPKDSPESINGTSGAVAHSRGPSAAIPYLSYLTYNRSGNTESPNPNSDQVPASPVPPNIVESSQVSREPTTAEQSTHLESAVSSTPTITSKPAPVKRPAPKAVAFNRWRQRVDLESSTSTGQTSSPLSAADDKYDQAAVWNTLLELYLTSSQEGQADKDANATLRRKAIYVLQNEKVLPYDATHALIVCSTQSFTEGLVLLWEKMGMYEDVLRFWMDRSERAYRGDSSETDGSPEEASARVVQYLKLYGPAHPHLYTLVLRFLTSSPALLSRHTDDLANVLEHINREKIIPPVGVIQILSRNEVSSVGLVKDWLMTRIAESRDEIDADRQLIESYRGETKAKLQEIAELSDPEHPRVFHVTRCSSCHGQLDLPTVHFMCNHSYHQRCVPEHDTECPNCARDHGLIREIRRENKQFAAQHDLFMYNVEREGFSAIASAFSKGIIGVGVADNV